MTANTPAKLDKTPLRQVQNVKHLLMNEGARDQLSMVAARHLNPERMMRVTANAIRLNPKLGQCEPMSFLGALMQCASLGLEPNTVMGHAYLIPFDKRAKVDGKWQVVATEVQVVIGYKGLIDLARRSGHIVSISANIHYSDDDLWEYEEGTEATLRHRPGMQEGDKLHAYAIAQFRDGGHAYVVLPWSKVISIRDSSQGWQQAVRTDKTASTPWGQYEDEMAKKTAIRALAKYLPLSIEFADAITTDGEKMDYRAFAMNPDMGVMPSEDNDHIDGTAEEVDQGTAQPKQEQAAQVQDNRASQMSMPIQEQRTAEPEPARQRRASAPPQQQAAPAAQIIEERPAGIQGPDYTTILNRIAGDLLDGADASELVSAFHDEIGAMKIHAPAIFDRLKDEVASWDANVAAKL